MVGGLELARDFSLGCMVGVTAIAYLVTRKLFGRPAALFASAAYSSAGVVLFLGRLATYDALCLLLIALATAASVHGGMARRPWITVAIGPALVLAILSKYAAMLFVPPAFGLLACLGVVFLGWWRALVRLVMALAAFAVSLTVAYKTMDRAAFHAISGSTTNRVVGLRAPRLALFTHVLEMGGLILLIAFFGVFLALRYRSRSRLAAVVLFGASWLAPVYHIYMHEPISLDKHIAYALFFAAPLAGYALAWLSGYGRKPLFSAHEGYWLAGLAIVLAISTVGLGQSRTLYANWADTSSLSAAMHTQFRDGSGRILAEDIEVARFDAMDITEPWQWNSFYYPYYITPQHHFLFGNQALVEAIRTRYYSWIEMSFIYLPQSAYFTAGQMAATRNYDLIAVIGFENSYGKGHFYLWRSALVPGHGNFTSLAQLNTKQWGG
jgi:hypothetical protein